MMVQRCRGAEVKGVQSEVQRCRGFLVDVQVQRCSGVVGFDMEVQKYKYKGADVQVCRYRCSRGAKMQRCRSSEVQNC